MAAAKTAVVVVLSLTAICRAAAQTTDRGGRSLDADASGGARTVQEGEISLQQAIAIARQQHRGRVVRAETKTENGRRVHEIRILGDDGRVTTVRIDAGGRGR